jgi:hypothetical protein
MPGVTYYVALPFLPSNDGVAAGEAVECNPNAAVMKAEALSRKLGIVGAVAFSRSGHTATGEFGDATVIRKFGDVPDDLMGGPVDAPLLGHVQATSIGEDGAGICVPLRYLPAKNLRPQARIFARPSENPVSVARMHRGVTIAMEDDGRHRGASPPDRSSAAPLHSGQCRRKVAGRPVSQAGVDADGGV